MSQVLTKLEEYKKYVTSNQSKLRESPSSKEIDGHIDDATVPTKSYDSPPYISSSSSSDEVEDWDNTRKVAPTLQTLGIWAKNSTSNTVIKKDKQKPVQPPSKVTDNKSGQKPSTIITDKYEEDDDNFTVNL